LAGLGLGRQDDQGVEELGEALAAEEALAWRSQPRRAAVGPGPLVGGGGRVPAGGR
jgi:hypothetical protein